MIKNASELANVLGMAFAAYANRVQNGATAPYNAFLEGKDEVTVTVKLVGDSIIVKPYVEAQVVVESITVSAPVLEEQPVEAVVVEEPEKPKRRRKTPE